MSETLPRSRHAYHTIFSLHFARGYFKKFFRAGEGLGRGGGEFDFDGVAMFAVAATANEN